MIIKTKVRRIMQTQWWSRSIFPLRRLIISSDTKRQHLFSQSTKFISFNKYSRSFGTYVSVIGLHWKTDEKRLRDTFEKFGKLEKATLTKPPHSNTHQWATLVYDTFDEALEAVIEMNGQELDGRLLRVGIRDPPADGEEELDLEERHSNV